jgi:hypothetical protein
MNFEDFKRRALRTESPGHAYARMENPVLVLAITDLLDSIQRVGETANMAKRHLYYGKPWTPEPPVEAANGACAGNRLNGTHCEAVMHPQFKRMLHAVLGKASEVAEMVEIMKWMLDHGGGALRPVPEDLHTKEVVTRTDIEFTTIHAGEEFADDAWYNALWADAAGFHTDTALVAVLAKLLERFPEAFTEEAAGDRDLDAEATALAGGAA